MRGAHVNVLMLAGIRDPSCNSGSHDRTEKGSHECVAIGVHALPVQLLSPARALARVSH